MYLIVSQVNILHGQQSQFVGAVRVAPVFHVTGNGEQLHGRHDVRGGVDNDLVGRLETDGRALAQVEGVQGTIGRILDIVHVVVVVDFRSKAQHKNLVLGRKDTLTTMTIKFFFRIDKRINEIKRRKNKDASFTLVAHCKANVRAQLDNSSCWT